MPPSVPAEGVGNACSEKATKLACFMRRALTRSHSLAEGFALSVGQGLASLIGTIPSADFFGRMISERIPVCLGND
jgi:hypothetical protein